MQIVIEIPDRFAGMIGFTTPEIEVIVSAVLHGTPLPKGHGKLKDVDDLYENTEICHSDEDGYACVRWKDINDAPTIIEAQESEG